MMKTSKNDTRAKEMIWRLSLRTKQGRNLLIAASLDHNATLPMLVNKVTELTCDHGTRKCPLLFVSKAYMVTLDKVKGCLLRSPVNHAKQLKPSRQRFEDLWHRRDVKAFNNEAFEAVFHGELMEKTITVALRNAWRFGVAPDLLQHYSDQFASEISSYETPDAMQVSRPPSPRPSARHEVKALLITYELNPLAVLLIVTFVVLVIGVLIGLGIGISTKQRNFAVGCALAVATVAVTYASFAKNVYALVRS